MSVCVCPVHVCVWLCVCVFLQMCYKSAIWKPEKVKIFKLSAEYWIGKSSRKSVNSWKSHVMNNTNIHLILYNINRTNNFAPQTWHDLYWKCVLYAHKDTVMSHLLPLPWCWALRSLCLCCCLGDGWEGYTVHSYYLKKTKNKTIKSQLEPLTVLFKFYINKQPKKS